MATDGSTNVGHSGLVNTKNTSNNTTTKAPVFSNNNYNSKNQPIQNYVYSSPNNLDGSTNNPLETQTFTCDPSSQNCESTQRLVLTNIDQVKQLLNGTNQNYQTPMQGLEDRLNTLTDQVQADNQSKLYEFLDNSGIKPAFESLLPVSPWEALTNGSDTGSSSNCSFDFEIYGINLPISLCASQPYIHTGLNFIFFFLTTIGIFGIIFEKET
jgi:hypothetical protein